MTRTSGLIANVIWSVLSHLFSRGCLIIAAIILARALDAQRFAEYSYFQMTVSMLSIYAALGLGITTARFFSEANHKDLGDCEDVFPLGALWLLSIVLAFAGGLFILLLPEQWLNAGLDIPRWLLALGVLTLTSQVVPGNAIIGLEKFKQAAFVALFSGLLLTVVAAIAAWIESPTLAMLGIVLAASVQGIGETLIVVHTLGWARLKRGAGFSWRRIRQLIEFAGPMVLVSLLSISGSWVLGRMILRQIDGAVNFSMYAIGLQWYALALMLPILISKVLLPRFVRNASGNQPSSKLLRQGVLVSIGSALTVAVVGVVASSQLLALYGKVDEQGEFFMVGYFVAAVINAPGNTIGNAVIADDGQKEWLAVTIVWLVALTMTGSMMMQFGTRSGSLALIVAALAQMTMALTIARRRRLI